MQHINFEAHGVKLDVEVQDERLLPAVERILPPGWRSSGDFPEDGHFTLSRDTDGTLGVFAEGQPIGTGLSAEVAVHVLDAQVRARIALLAPSHIFVHAGAVALGDRALLLPGPNFSGKSALVAALVTAGATYYSDEYAVLDLQGLVHPYARPLSIRSETDRWGTYTSPESLGGGAGTAPLRVGLIVATNYVPGAVWAPERGDAGAGALALLANALPARSRTEATVHTVARAAMNARTLSGPRGEADETARILLEEFAR
jgi:hypothetical protein